MALFAFNLLVFTDEWIRGFAVIKRFAIKFVEVGDVVTRCAVAAEFVFVWVFVAAAALFFGADKLRFALW